jgi:hypothetical protein
MINEARLNLITPNNFLLSRFIIKRTWKTLKYNQKPKSTVLLIK